MTIRKRLYILILIITTMIVLTSLAVVLILKNKNDSKDATSLGISSVAVNGVRAESNGDDFIVYIPQCKNVSLNCIYSTACQYKWYDESGRTLDDLESISIDGKDTDLKYVLSKNELVRITGTLSIINIVSENEGLSLIINNVNQSASDGEILIKLPPKTSVIESVDITLSEFFSYKLFLDIDKTDELNSLSDISLLSVYYLDIYNVNKVELFKSYIVRIAIQPSSDIGLRDVAVNGKIASQIQDNFSVTIDKTSYISVIATQKDEQSKVDLLIGNIVVDDTTNIFISEKEHEHVFKIRVTAENGDLKDYELKVILLYDSVNTVETVEVNDIVCYFEDGKLSVLLDRSDNISINIQLTSILSKAKVYSDYSLENEVSDISNIDTSNCELSLQYYILVTAENGDCKHYILDVYFIPSDDCVLNNVSINGLPVVFLNQEAQVDILGKDFLVVMLSDISISKYAKYKIYTDESTKYNVEDINAVEISYNFNCIYFEIQSEDGKHTKLYKIGFTIISNDNSLSGITVNNKEYVILSESETIYIESSSTISITNMVHDINATVNAFYNVLQTESVTDFTNIKYSNNQADLFIRVVAESSDIRVYHIILIIKGAPEIEFKASSVLLSDWQDRIAFDSIFDIISNSYLQGQYSVVVLWDGIIQSSQYIYIENINRIHTLNIRIESPFFATEEYSKQIEIMPYTLTPISVDVISDKIEISQQTETIPINQFININNGSYVLGKHFYIAIYKDAITEIITNLNQSVAISPGTFNMRVCSIGEVFDDFSVGMIKVEQREFDPPEILVDNYYEFVPNRNKKISLHTLFTILSNGNNILLVSTYINGCEDAEIVLDEEERYEIKVVVLYDKGTIEKTFIIDVVTVSNNIDAYININGDNVAFIDNKYTAELAYDEELYLTAIPASDKAQVVLNVNGVTTEFGDIILTDGINQIIVTITAQSGDIAEYLITIDKKPRVLPEIFATDKTVKLTYNQSYISIADCYLVNENDYSVESVSLIYNGMNLYGDILPVSNENRTYDIVVMAKGEFGTIEKSFKLGVIRYSQVRINFKSQIVRNEAGHIFSVFDFIEKIDFIGYDEPYRYEVYLGDSVFVGGMLEDGAYIITVKAWKNDVLLREVSAVFTVNSCQQEQTVYVQQNINEVWLEEYNQKLNFDEIFTINCGEYDRDGLDIYYIINGLRSYNLNLIVGKNTFDVVIVEISSQIELFAKTFTVNCDYRPTAQKVFNSLSVNGSMEQINGNVVAIVSSNQHSSIDLAYTLNSGFTVLNLAKKYNVHNGVNYIGFTVIKNGHEVSCVLEVYILNNLSDYINAARYATYTSDNNIISATSETKFDISKFSIDLFDNHIKTEITYKQVEPNVYDITVNGKYSGVDIGRIIIRVFIGKEKPILRNVVLSVTDESIVSYSINEFSVDLICVSDNTTIKPVFNNLYDKYRIDCNIEDLEIGLNHIAFTLFDSETFERFTYTINIALFPVDLISSVEYAGMQLQRKNNIYVAEVDSVLYDSIRYLLDERVNLRITSKSQQQLYNGVIVGYDYSLFYEYVEIYRFSVAALNDNISVKVLCDRVELNQYGNDKFVLNLNVDKASQEGELIKQFKIQSLYPYTEIIGEGVKIEQDGYSIIVNFGDISELELGAKNETMSFSAVSLKNTFDYTIVIDLIVSEMDESTTPLVITANNKDKLYFSEADLEKEFIMSGRTLHASIFERELVLTISGTGEYYFYENNLKRQSIVLTAAFDGYLNFYIIKDHYPKRVAIRCVYTDDNNAVIDTGIRINGEEILIAKNASVTTVVYGGIVYDDVLIANKTLTLPLGTTEVEAEFFGYLAEDDSFVFADGSVGKSGVLSIQGDRLIIWIDDYGTKVPYAIIEIEFSEDNV